MNFKWDLNNWESKSLSDDNDLYADWPNQRCYWINGKDTIYVLYTIENMTECELQNTNTDANKWDVVWKDLYMYAKGQV